MQIVKEESNVQICCHTQDCFASTHTFHWHDNYEICQVMKSRCRFLIDGKIIDADEGDIITVSEHTVHRFLVDHDGIFVRIVQFPPHILLHTSFVSQPLRTHITAAELASVDGLAGKLEILFSLMEQEDILKEGDENAYLSSLASSAYFLLMRHFADPAVGICSNKERMEFFRIVAYCNEHFSENLNVQSLADRLYISRGHLGTLFSRYAGMTLGDYLGSLRIKNANRLIRQGYSITQAALDSGFHSIRTFNNVYKKLTGITPTEQLRALREDP